MARLEMHIVYDFHKIFECHNAVCGYKYNVNVIENIGLKLLNPLSLTLIVSNGFKKSQDF